LNRTEFDKFISKWLHTDVTRRDDAINAGLRLFAEQGYAGTTTAQIEAAMGLSPGAGGLFRHVGSKQELLEAGIERALARRYTPPSGPFSSPADALAQAVLGLVDADRDLWRLLLREGRGLPCDIDDVYARVVQPAFDMAVDWVREHSDDSPDVVARVVTGISALLYLRTSQMIYGRTPSGIDEQAFVAVARTLFGEAP
jgi:AcrR family transcriptional regulator